MWEVRTGDSLASFEYHCFDRKEDAEWFIETGEKRRPHLFTMGQLYALYS